MAKSEPLSRIRDAERCVEAAAGGQPLRPLFHGMKRVRRFHIAVLDASAEDLHHSGGDTFDQHWEAAMIATDTTQRAAGPLSTTGADIRRRIRETVVGPLRIVNAFMSVAVLRWILIVFGAVVVAVWWISTRFGRPT